MDTLQKIKITNTLTQKKEDFVPLKKGIVSLYSCGPTVYDFAHIGNFRSFLMSDLLFRVFQYGGYEVKKVQNITDVGHLTNDDIADSSGEDKISKKAKAEKKDPFQIAQKFEKFFVEDEKVLRIIPPNAGRPRATDYIVEQLDLTKDLVKKGFAYVINGSVYFRVSLFPAYGKLSKNKREDLIAGARVETNDEKEDPMDFALWKKAEANHLMQWDYESGKKNNPQTEKTTKNYGFPGWHIECSAMSQKLLGKNFDIHTGGEDNIFPHHECEIAQNECGHGGKINYWLHGKHLLVEGEKMSKSKGNFYTIRDLQSQGWMGNEIRLALMKAHYRSSLNFSQDLLEESRENIKKLEIARDFFTRISVKIDSKKTPSKTGPKRHLSTNSLPDLGHFLPDYQSAIFDDLNMPEALSVVFQLIAYGYKLRESKKLTPEIAVAIVIFLEEHFDPIFDIFSTKKEISSEKEAFIKQQIEARNQARADKNWALSDQIRDSLKNEGIELIDEGDKTRWKIY